MSGMWEKDLNIQDLEVLEKALDDDGIDIKKFPRNDSNKRMQR
jgi:2-hydroxychromene-2-carboxylate isomerase